MQSARSLATLASLAALAVPASAEAHVTLQPPTAPAGGSTRLDVRVPDESDSAATTRVEVQLPHGIVFASYEPVPGWKVRVTTRKLAQPIKTDDGEVTEGVQRITWTARASAGIPPGAFQDFGLAVQLPGKAGDTLTFKALQTYGNGEVVRWIGPEGSPNPAPTVSLTAAAASTAHAAARAPAPARTLAAGTDTLSIVALIAGALGLAAGVLALVRAR